jgi:hypothetical protein
MRTMRFRRPAVGALVAVAALAFAWLDVHGQSLPGSPVRPAGPPPTGFSPPTPRVGGVLLGQVVDATSGRGVARAIVRMSGRGPAQTRVTDDKGRFYFTDVPDADLSLVATKTGFFDGAYGRRRAGGTGIPLTMSNGQWITDLRLELFKAAVIRGIVVDEANEPLVGVRVRAWRREFAEGREQLAPAGDATTDDEGMYRLFGLKPGDYIVSVPSVQVALSFDTVEAALASSSITPEMSALLSLSHASAATDRLVQPDGKTVLLAGRNATGPPPERGATFAYRTEFYPGFGLPAQALPVTVGPGQDLAGVHFQLHLVPTYRVSGIVVGKDGPVAHQLLRLVLDGADDEGFGNEAATTVTGADGTFTLLNVPAGDYAVQVRALTSVLTAASPDLDPGDALVTGPTTRAWGSTNVAVHDADVNDVIVGIRPGLTISGQVVVEHTGAQRSIDQLLRTAIGLLPDSRAVGSTVTTRLNTSGRFTFGDLMPGSYFLRVSALPAGWSVKSVRSGGGRDLLDLPLDLGNDADVIVTLTDRQTQVFGTVHDQRGVVVAGATVLVLPPPASSTQGLNPNRMRETRAATSGVFTIDGLPAGDYYLVAIDDAAAEGWQDPRRLHALRALATRVLLRDAEKKTVDLRLTRK